MSNRDIRRQTRTCIVVDQQNDALVIGSCRGDVANLVLGPPLRHHQMKETPRKPERSTSVAFERRAGRTADGASREAEQSRKRIPWHSLAYPGCEEFLSSSAGC